MLCESFKWLYALDLSRSLIAQGRADGLTERAAYIMNPAALYAWVEGRGYRWSGERWALPQPPQPPPAPRPKRRNFWQRLFAIF